MTTWPYIQMNSRHKLEDIPEDHRKIIEGQFYDIPVINSPFLKILLFCVNLRIDNLSLVNMLLNVILIRYLPAILFHPISLTFDSGLDCLFKTLIRGYSLPVP